MVISSRFLSSFTLVSLSVVAATVSCTGAFAQRITGTQFIGQATFDVGTVAVSSHTNGAEQTSIVGGLSGISYDSSRGVYYANSDDRGNRTVANQNTAARFYTVSLNTSRSSGGNAVFGQNDVIFNSYTSILRPDGSAFPFVTTGPTATDVNIDPEDIALSPDGQSVYIVSEGDKANSTAGVAVPSFVNRFNLATGVQEAALPVPTAYQNTVASDTSSGARNNLSFESLTINGNTLLTGVENALYQDGPINTFGASTSTRLLAYDLTTSTVSGEYRYNLDGIVEQPTGTNFATAGLCDLLSLGGNQYLALERSFTVGGALGGGLKGDGSTAAATGYAVKLYQFSLDGVENGGTVNKELVLDLNTLGIALDNIEGVELGGTLANGDQSLILVSDDNFNSGAQQFTQFVTLGIQQSAVTIPEANPLALLAVGLPVVGFLVVKRRLG